MKRWYVMLASALASCSHVRSAPIRDDKYYIGVVLGESCRINPRSCIGLDARNALIIRCESGCVRVDMGAAQSSGMSTYDGQVLGIVCGDSVIVSWSNRELPTCHY